MRSRPGLSAPAGGVRSPRLRATPGSSRWNSQRWATGTIVIAVPPSSASTRRDPDRRPVGDDALQQVERRLALDRPERRSQRPVAVDHHDDVGLGVGRALEPQPPVDRVDDTGEEPVEALVLGQPDDAAAVRDRCERGEAVVTSGVDDVEVQLVGGGASARRRGEGDHRRRGTGADRTDQRQAAVGRSPCERNTALVLRIIDPADRRCRVVPTRARVGDPPTGRGRAGTATARPTDGAAPRRRASPRRRRSPPRSPRARCGPRARRSHAISTSCCTGRSRAVDDDAVGRTGEHGTRAPGGLEHDEFVGAEPQRRTAGNAPRKLGGEFVTHHVDGVRLVVESEGETEVGVGADVVVRPRRQDAASRAAGGRRGCDRAARCRRAPSGSRAAPWPARRTRR